MPLVELFVSPDSLRGKAKPAENKCQYFYPKIHRDEKRHTSGEELLEELFVNSESSPSSINNVRASSLQKYQLNGITSMTSGSGRICLTSWVL